MNLIDRTYFDGPLLLVGVNDAATRAAIDLAITRYQLDYLQAALGPSLCAALLSGLASPSGVYFSTQFSSQFNHGTIADRWKWIRDGYMVTYGGRSYVWPGLVNSRKRSPIANYVFWHYCYDNYSQPIATGGRQIAKQENATVVSPAVDMRRAWNQMVDWNVALSVMMATMTDDDDLPLYPEFVRAELALPESINVYAKQNP